MVCRTHPIIGPLVHMHTFDANRRRVEVEIDTPERRPERVRQAGLALVVQGVGFAQDHGWRRRIGALDRVVLDNVGVDRRRGALVVHERAL